MQVTENKHRLESPIIRAKISALTDVYIELLRNFEVPYSVCMKIKEKINNLEKILFVDEFLSMEPISLLVDECTNTEHIPVTPLIEN